MHERYNIGIEGVLGRMDVALMNCPTAKGRLLVHRGHRATGMQPLPHPISRVITIIHHILKPDPGAPGALFSASPGVGDLKRHKVAPQPAGVEPQ